jgi:hypothetical protein
VVTDDHVTGQFDSLPGSVLAAFAEAQVVSGGVGQRG